ncbi:hypothetical protein FOZG_09514 [Fusarium oxysporum Fo47]|uniref:Major facilitator superfamily (MFS) profile domain-containing protein n=2 Tax=Fusarium oxysporum Fo47 TaxID=660027 RepID=W9KDU9_FUSOX|nr:hypothetical protein FOZG_09514 [Fusarium oxysporum Fo47]
MEALVWGFLYSFGVFQDYYQSHLPFARSSNTATIGTCAMGVLFFMFPIVIALQRLYPRQARWAPVCGLMVICLALLTSSFSQSVPHLIITQGVIYALPGSITYFPAMFWLGEWFIERRGFGYGVMWSGSGIGGSTIPLILELLLQTTDLELHQGSGPWPYLFSQCPSPTLSSQDCLQPLPWRSVLLG